MAGDDGGWLGANRDPTDYINIRILFSGSKAKDKGIPEIVVCRILMLM